MLSFFKKLLWVRKTPTPKSIVTWSCYSATTPRFLYIVRSCFTLRCSFESILCCWVHLNTHQLLIYKQKPVFWKFCEVNLLFTRELEILSSILSVIWYFWWFFGCHGFFKKKLGNFQEFWLDLIIHTQRWDRNVTSLIIGYLVFGVFLHWTTHFKNMTFADNQIIDP